MCQKVTSRPRVARYEASRHAMSDVNHAGSVRLDQVATQLPQISRRIDFLASTFRLSAS
jgi:hypothetical protein